MRLKMEINSMNMVLKIWFDEYGFKGQMSN